jgi:hypothetical protein
MDARSEAAILYFYQYLHGGVMIGLLKVVAPSYRTEATWHP